MNTATRNATLVSTLVLLTACAGQQTKLTSDDLRSLSSQPQIHVVHHLPARIFWVEGGEYSAAGTLISPLVVILQMQESKKLQNRLKLADPAPHVKDRLMRALKTNLNLTNARPVSDPPKSDDMETLKQAFQTGVVLDVRTMKWGIDNNRAKYSARARLVRLADSSILWEATCSEFVADKAKPSPTMEALTANDGELLRIKLGEVADLCADQLRAWATTR